MALILITFKPFLYKDENKLQGEYDSLLNKVTTKYFKSYDTQEHRTLYFISYSATEDKEKINLLLPAFKEFNNQIKERYKVDVTCALFGEALEI
jgi:hypothetical protein